MPTISAKVSKKELDAIQEYANACGETVSNLIRKVLINEATFMKWSADSHEYDYEMIIPDDLDGEEESQIIKAKYDKIRRIVGLSELDEI